LRGQILFGDKGDMVEVKEKEDESVGGEEMEMVVEGKEERGDGEWGERGGGDGGATTVRKERVF